MLMIEKIMSYNSFTNKNKLQNAELNNNIQSNKISLQKYLYDTMVNRTVKSQPLGQNLTNTIQWDSEWELVESRLVGSVVTEIWKNWIISLGEFNYTWLRNFQVEIICKNGLNGDGDSTGFSVGQNLYYKRFIGWGIKDIEGKETSDIKNVSLVAGLYSYKPTTLPVFYTKLLVKYINQARRG